MEIFKDFILSEENSYTINGERYISYPVSQKDSYGLIMKFIPVIDSDECYEQKFILKDNSLKEYSKRIKISCND